MVMELVPAGADLKGAAVRRLAKGTEFTSFLYAGDDQADLEAFAVMDSLKEEGMATTKVGVRGSETPAALLEAADVVVDSPEELIALLGKLTP
jgi:trehalose-6-phosphatase